MAHWSHGKENNNTWAKDCYYYPCAFAAVLLQIRRFLINERGTGMVEASAVVVAKQ